MKKMINYFCILALIGIHSGNLAYGLYPFESETRETKSLDGIWKFRLSPQLDPEKGFDEKWYSSQEAWKPSEVVLDMPVPSSYNDITTSSQIRDFVGWAWYFRTFFVPASWIDKVNPLKGTHNMCTISVFSYDTKCFVDIEWCLLAYITKLPPVCCHKSLHTVYHFG